MWYRFKNGKGFNYLGAKLGLASEKPIDLNTTQPSATISEDIHSSPIEFKTSFTEPSTEAIQVQNNLEVSNFVIFDKNKEVEFCMKGKEEGRRRRRKKAYKDRLEKQKHGEILIIDEAIKSQKQREEETDFSDTLEIMYAESEPVPLQMDISSQEEDMEANATEWVQANMLNLRIATQKRWIRGFKVEDRVGKKKKCAICSMRIILASFVSLQQKKLSTSESFWFCLKQFQG